MKIMILIQQTQESARALDSVPSVLGVRLDSAVHSVMGSAARLDMDSASRF